MAFGDILSSLAGFAGTALTGGLNYFGQQAANKQNLLMSSGAYKAQQVNAEASALGVSPLAVLGNAPQNIPFQAAQYPDFGPSGQNLGRAVAASDPKGDVAARLQMQSLMLSNAKLANEVTAGQMVNSVRAASLSQPGTARASVGDVFPPPRATTEATKEHPYPMYEWYFDSENPSRPPIKVISDRYAHTQFGPTAYYTGLAAMPGMLEGWANTANEYFGAQGRILRGDILRNMQGAPRLPDYWSEYGGQ